MNCNNNLNVNVYYTAPNRKFDSYESQIKRLESLKNIKRDYYIRNLCKLNQETKNEIADYNQTLIEIILLDATKYEKEQAKLEFTEQHLNNIKKIEKLKRAESDNYENAMRKIGKQRKKIEKNIENIIL